MKAAAADGSANGMGIALSIAAGLVILLATGWFLVNRRWPLPDLVRHFRR
jgi:serine-type D-Ala-D-Ala carboxypeptidase (penicillin-binding protein 5/6)